MTPTDDWPQVESMESSTDLFAGDILGDELIDIYNAAVVGGSEDEAMNAPAIDPDKKEALPLNHPVAEVADTDSAIDDGLGAFRPSTSFNDLSTLFPGTPGTTATEEANAPGATPVKLEEGNPTDTQKRAAADAPAETPTAKRQASTERKNSEAGTASPTKIKVNETTGQKDKASQAEKNGSTEIGNQENKDTPNPLTTANPPSQAASGVILPQVKPVVKATAAVASAPAVVSPRVQTQVMETVAISTAPAPPSLSAPPTEADFKSVAQAAVSNLILNVGNSGKPDVPSSGTDGELPPMQIDTSTEHIKALTGTNWVAVCSGGDVCPSASAAADKMNNRARRQNLTPDERARQNRDRNREHARNTRLRKKAYVEELKSTLTALVSQRDSAELEKRHSAQRELEQREVRFRVIEEFLKLRGRNEGNFARWAAILEENFTLALPATGFLGMAHPDSPRKEHEHVLSGVSAAMAEANVFASFLQTLGKEKGEISFVYNCDRKNFFMDNCVAVLDWNASTHGVVQQGAPAELTMKGSLQATFSPASNKLISVAILFDTGIVSSQLNKIFKVNEVSNDDVDAAAAAQVAACEADMILDSLQMPHIEPVSVPSNVNVVPTSCGSASGPASITDFEKEDSSDESNPDSSTDDAAKGMTTRRVLRRKD